MKVIPLVGMQRTDREEAQREAHLLQRLDHPNIIRYYESFESPSAMRIITEYASRGDLNAFIKSRKTRHIPEAQILDWFVQICLGMKHLHERHILHRDVKTSNIFLNEKGVVKLGDFGISKLLAHTMQCAKTAVGTPYYMSPEICQNKPYNNRSDVWAMGCVLYELAALKHAFEAHSMKALVAEILRGRYKPVPSQYSADYNAILSMCLDSNPLNRPSVHVLLQQEVIKARIQAFLMGKHENIFAKKAPVQPRKNGNGNVNGKNANPRVRQPSASPPRRTVPAKHPAPSTPPPALVMGVHGVNPSPAPTPKVDKSKVDGKGRISKTPAAVDPVGKARKRVTNVRHKKPAPSVPAPAPTPLPHNVVSNELPPLQRHEVVAHQPSTTSRNPPQKNVFVHPEVNPSKANAQAFRRQPETYALMENVVVVSPSSSCGLSSESNGGPEHKRLPPLVQDGQRLRPQQQQHRSVAADRLVLKKCDIDVLGASRTRTAAVNVFDEFEAREDEEYADDDLLRSTMREALDTVGGEDDFFNEKGGDGGGDEPYTKSSALRGRFQLDGHTFKVPNVHSEDSLSYRVEVLRQYLDDLLGTSHLVAAYSILKNAEPGEVCSKTNHLTPTPILQPFLYRRKVTPRLLAPEKGSGPSEHSTYRW